MENNIVKQLDLFGAEPETIKKKRGRKKLSSQEKQERREKKAIEKKLKEEKEFEDYWASVGKPQLYMFDNDGNVIKNEEQPLN